MSEAFTQIIAWIPSLKYWEQATFARILNGQPFDDDTYKTLLQYLLEDEKLVKLASERPQLSFSQAGLPGVGHTEKITLSKISNLQHVNQLVPNQTLTFCSSLTAVYGGNASGKSGYARVFGCAGFTRGDRQVLPDVTKACSATITPSADIEICCDGDTQKICYRVDSRCAELASFHVFDATSVLVHLTQPFQFSFSPGGLKYLTRLAEETDKVRERLKTLIQSYNQPHQFRPFFQGKETLVTKLIDALGPKTNIQELEKLATLSQKDEQQIKLLDEKIAKIKAQNVQRQISNLSQQITDLVQLEKQLEKVTSGLSDSLFEQLTKQIKAYKEAETSVKKLSLDKFQSSHFTQIGTPLWSEFVQAAKNLAEMEGTPEKPYPQPQDHCLLCHQSLSDEAHRLLHLLWAYLKGEAQADLDRVKSYLNNARTKINSVSLNFFSDQSVSYRNLDEQNPPLRQQITAFLSKSTQHREALLAMIDNRRDQAVPPLSRCPISDVQAHRETIEKRLQALREQDQGKELAILEQQLLELNHRLILREHFAEIKTYVVGRAWAQMAATAGGSTRQITIKHNELFEQLVAKGYVKEFQQNIELLGRRINVTLETIPRKGESFRQIVLQSCDATAPALATPEKVLSEGEKRAVALADFLTEIKLSGPHSSIILDDPVTSLDIEWRGKIASLLVAEAKNRQVIVFTHDLPFLYFLKKHAEIERVELANHWVKRGDRDDLPGYVFLDNSPALEKDYKNTKKAEEYYKMAKDLAAEKQEDVLKQGFGALRTCYEAFVMYDIFGGVVLRFEERLSLDRLRDLVWDDSILSEVMTRYGSLSRYIEGHSHSDSLYGAVKVTPNLLSEEIAAFKAVKKKLKDLKTP